MKKAYASKCSGFPFCKWPAVVSDLSKAFLALGPPKFSLSRVKPQNLEYSAQPEEGISDQRSQLPWSEARDQVQDSAFTIRKLLRLVSPNDLPESFPQKTSGEGLPPDFFFFLYSPETSGETQGLISTPPFKVLVPHTGSIDEQA